MPEYSENHPLATVPGVLAIAAWALYVGSAVLYYPEFPPSVIAIGISGVVACLAVAFNFKYWRAVVVLACLVHLVLYVIRVIRMTGLTTSDTSFLSSITSYYSISWQLASSMFQEKGLMGGMTHAYLEYLMPVLMVVLIAVTLLSRRSKPSV